MLIIILVEHNCIFLGGITQVCMVGTLPRHSSSVKTLPLHLICSQSGPYHFTQDHSRVWYTYKF